MTTAFPVPGCGCATCERRRMEGAFLGLAVTFDASIQSQTKALRARFPALREISTVRFAPARFPLAAPERDHDPTLGCARWMPEPKG